MSRAVARPELGVTLPGRQHPRVAAATAETPVFTTRPEIAGTFGVVASTHWLATAVGMSVLERGGNAFDAAAATAFTLQVAEPHLNGPGGDAPIILHSATHRHAGGDLRPGPGAGRGDHRALRRAGAGPDPGHRPAAGRRARGVRRLVQLLRDYGTLGAGGRAGVRHRLCRGGVPLVPRIPATIESVRPLFEAEWPSSAAVFLPGGEAPRWTSPSPTRRWPRPIAGSARGGRGHAGGADRGGAATPGTRASWPRRSALLRGREVLDASGRRHRGLLTGAGHGRWRRPWRRRRASTTTGTRC